MTAVGGQWRLSLTGWWQDTVCYKQYKRFIFWSFLSEVKIQGWGWPTANQLLASGAGKWFTEWSEGQTSGQSHQKKLLRMSLSSNTFFRYGGKWKWFIKQACYTINETWPKYTQDSHANFRFSVADALWRPSLPTHSEIVRCSGSITTRTTAAELQP